MKFPFSLKKMANEIFFDTKMAINLNFLLHHKSACITFLSRVQLFLSPKLYILTDSYYRINCINKNIIIHKMYKQKHNTKNIASMV